ncbi:MAG: hypothetical protein WCO18_00065 [bacterium]
MRSLFSLKNKKTNTGQAVMITLVIFIIISVTLISGGTLPTGTQVKNSNTFFRNIQSYAAADSVNNDIFYVLNNGGSVFSGITLPFSISGVSASATIVDLVDKKEITADGNSFSKIKTSKMILSENFGVNLNYAVQADTGGLTLSNTTVNGDVYSNGNILSDNRSIIQGSTTVARLDDSNVGKILSSSNDQSSPLKISGSAWAHDIEYSKVSGNSFCQTSNYLFDSTESIVNCDTSRDYDPSIRSLPISETNMTDWKNAVTNQTDTVSSEDIYNSSLTIGGEGTTTSIKEVGGDLILSCDNSHSSNFGNLYVTGNVHINNGCIVNADAVHIGGTLSISENGILNLAGMSYVNGNVNVSGSGEIQLDRSLGTNSGYIISDGVVAVSSGGVLNDPNTSGNFLVVITTSSSNEAIRFSGGNSLSVLVSPNGKAILSNGSVDGIIANTVDLTGGSINYQNGLSSIVFGGIPSGKWHILSWDEVSN